MAVQNVMFLFEVVVESVQTFMESRIIIMKSDFSDVFSLELKDPKKMHITIPETPPPPPEPPGKKKKKPPKPKKGKKGKVEAPPPEPIIQAGQSVLFTSNPEFLTQEMKNNPMMVSVWSKEDNLVCIGSCSIPWDPVFLIYLQQLYSCEKPSPPTVKDTYNIFEERTAKIIAKLTIQVKLTYLTDRVVSSFRTLSEDPTAKRVLYTGMNSKTTSYISTLKTTDEEYEENIKKIPNGFHKDKQIPRPTGPQPQIFADYRNAPGANLPIFKDANYCCMGHADKPPDDKYKSPETCPDIDFICDYVRKIITSCNDNMRMLTPRPTIRPRIKATDIDRLCYCRETSWPQSKLAERFRKEVQTAPCPVCVRDKDDKAQFGEVTPKVIDIANIRGPCGRHDCRIARDMRAYIADLVEEENKEVNISDIIGPCGSKSCTLVDRIKEFLTHQGVFAHGGATKTGLSTQCNCIEQMQNSLKQKKSCDSVCSHDCQDSDSEPCGGKVCPFKRKPKEEVYNVYYFTVEYDLNKEMNTSASSTESKASKVDTHVTSSSTRFQYCSATCPTLAANEQSCSKDICGVSPIIKKAETEKKIKCSESPCPTKGPYTPSPKDSDIIIPIEGIRNPCCVKTCSVAEEVREFIAVGQEKKSRPKSCMDPKEDPCYCDCICNFNFNAAKTTYCPVCGGYEYLGLDMKDQPEYAKPHPCPVYHKLYDRKVIKTKSPWPEENVDRTATDATTTKSGRTNSMKTDPTKVEQVADVKNESIKGVKKHKKKIGKFTATLEGAEEKPKKPPLFKPIEPVPKNMGWLWTAEDIPGMKPRPKWRPGAANKILVRRYRTVREGVDIIAKKKRALLNRKKKIEMKPTLVVKKHDGEYTVQMEVFKKYSKERLKFQYPYDEKPPLIYTIGKTEETKRKIQRQRERRERRETRRKSRLLQSTFRNKCQEICLKAYNQAIGVLPIPNPNRPDCACDVPLILPPSPVIDSCSCSGSGTISSSDTDGDDWVIEFTPPMARWDAKAKHPPTLANNESQYSYLDFRVKLLDQQGNPIPRFFKGPDGQQVCSDLGGFWGPGHVWQEINKDGFIGPDNRWIPMNFYGPDGVMYTAEDGAFTDTTGMTLRLGVDGYIDKDGKWAWYAKRKSEKSFKTASTTTVKGIQGRGVKEDLKQLHGKSTSGKESARKEVAGKNKTAMSAKVQEKDKKSVPQEGKGKSVSIKGKNAVVLNMSMSHDRPIYAKDYDRRQQDLLRNCDKQARMAAQEEFARDRRQQEFLRNCDRQARMMAQGENLKALEALRAMKYQEIMNELNTYDDLAYSSHDLRPMMMSKTSRAVNTPITEPHSPNLEVCAKPHSPQKSICTTFKKAKQEPERCY